MVQVAMFAGLSCTMLRDAVLAQPKVAEGLAALVASMPRG